jgi:hypothetical protein
MNVLYILPDKDFSDRQFTNHHQEQQQSDYLTGSSSFRNNNTTTRSTIEMNKTETNTTIGSTTDNINSAAINIEIKNIRHNLQFSHYTRTIFSILLHRGVCVTIASFQKKNKFAQDTQSTFDIVGADTLSA